MGILTERLRRVFHIADMEVEASNSPSLMPVHLLLGCLQEKTGVLGEITLKCKIDLHSLKRDSVLDQNIDHHPFFRAPVTIETKSVIDCAITYMKKYDQIYLNEGHLLKALINTKVIDHLITDEQKNIILYLGTVSRDMITHLGDYSFPNLKSHSIRKVNNDDFNKLKKLVEYHFSHDWAQTIQTGFLKDQPSIYIALNEVNEIIGFAAFDIFHNKKGYFGPMGVLQTQRTKGIGYQLLHHCLRDMKEIGYEYAIIGEAGPLEFYEKACSAVVIPTT